MNKILTISDFTGVYELPISSLNTTRATAILNKVESEIFVKMMGMDAYSKLIEKSLDGEGGLDISIDGEIQNFFEGLSYYEVDGLRVDYSDGFKNAILSFAWFDIMNDFNQFSSAQGILQGLTENAEASGNGAQVLCNMWNNGVRIYRDAYKHIIDYMIGVFSLDAEGEIFENIEHEDIEELTWI